MDFYQVAMQMEGQGRAFYLSLQEKAIHPSLKQLFGLLADEELDHYETFKKMSLHAGVFEAPIKRFSAEKVFDTLLAEGIDYTGEEGLLEAYQKAKDLEDNTVAYYKSYLGKTDKPLEKMALLKIYYEEKKHSLFLEHLIELIGDPLCQVSSAEWDRPIKEDVNV